MANIFVRSSYVLAIVFAIVVAVSGNRLYPKPQLNGEQVGHSLLQSALSLKRAYFYDSHQDHYTVHVRTTNTFITAAIATKSANKLTPPGGESVVRGRSGSATAIITVD
ncbi:unnamed protein product [Brassica rapa subsp. trilocularis]